MKQTHVVHIIDDDPLILVSLGDLLESEGFAVETHTSAKSFLRTTTLDEVGCVLTDVDMPGMTGLELMERLSGHGFVRPVIVMTGRPSARVSAEAAALGATDFLEKPFSACALIAGVRRACLSLT
jgi:two-component system response regulator FixJ